jgi:catechol 2,3-dioxygenase
MPVAHLGHAELQVPDLDASTTFFTDIVGLTVTERDDDAVYLRAWQDWDHHTLVLRRGERPGIVHVGWRVGGADDLAVHERALRTAGVPFTWIEGGSEPGQGDGLRFTSPGGVPFELYWEVEAYVAPAALASRLTSHPQRYASHGIAPRRFDHVNFLVDDVAAEQAWATSELGIHHRYFVEGSAGTRLGSWLSRTNLSHELALMRNREQTGSLLHHVAYYVESPDQLLRAATILRDHGVQIEWGPGQHGTSGAIFLYFFEPSSGIRVEVWTGGFLIFAPDWQAQRWDPEVAGIAIELWGSDMPDSYLRRGSEILIESGVRR